MLFNLAVYCYTCRRKNSRGLSIVDKDDHKLSLIKPHAPAMKIAQQT